MKRDAFRSSSWLLIGALLVLLLFFFCSLIIRWPYLSILSDYDLTGHLQWQTASTIKFVDNWVEDGIFNDGILLLERPRSIIDDQLWQRNIYPSYPPGATIPVFLLKMMLPNLSTLAVVRGVGLACQFLICICIFYSVFYILENKLVRQDRILWSTMAGLSYIYLPEPFYWHSMVYFSDVVVIFPFALVILLEILIRRRVPATNYLIAQSVILFYMSLVDYLAIPLALTILGGRLAFKIDLRVRFNVIVNLIQVIVPVLFGIIIFVFQIYYFDFYQPLIARFLVRTGAIPSPADNIVHFSRVIGGHLGAFGVSALLLSISGLVALCWKLRNCLLLPPAIAIVASLLQIYLLKNHSYDHDFSILKLYLPISIIIFGVLPAVLTIHIKPARSVFVNGVLAIAGFFILITNFVLTWKDEFPKPGLKYQSTTDAIRNRFNYKDVLIGLDGFKIDENPPQMLSVSKKIVYSFKSAQDLDVFLSHLPSEANLYYVIHLENPCIKNLEHYNLLGNDGFVYFSGNVTNVKESYKSCYLINH